jgi:ABC-type sugar transport system permease subunit
LKEDKVGWLFVLPCLFFIIGLGIFPTCYSIFLAFSEADLSGVHGFAGLENFSSLLALDDFWKSIGVTLQLTAFSVAGATILGLAVALVANQHFRGRSIIRTLMVVPWAMPVVVSALIWALTYDYSYGFVNSALTLTGIINEPIFFLSPQSALTSVSLTCMWILSSFTAVFVLSSLQTIDQVYYEAADLDGAGIFRKFRNITLPLIQPVLSITILFNSMVILTMFDVIYVMTRGGPGTATLTLSMQVFRTFFRYYNFGQGAAAAVVLAGLTMLVALPYMLFVYRRVYR